MGDIQEEKGKLVVQEFQTEFGVEYAHFCKVDLTKTADVQGESPKIVLKTTGNNSFVNERLYHCGNNSAVTHSATE